MSHGISGLKPEKKKKKTTEAMSMVKFFSFWLREPIY